MSAGDVTARSVLELRESMIETTMDDRWCARSVCEDAIEALEASRAEVAALRRQVEERGDAAPAFDVNRLDWLEGAWAEGNLRVYIAGARAGWEKCASLIRIPPGEVVATPQDTVVVGREEWEILRDGFGLLRTVWNISGFNERLSAQADALIERHDALRSGEAGKGAPHA